MAVQFISAPQPACRLKLAVPKGKLFEKVSGLLSEAGLGLSQNGRNYRPKCSDCQIEVKVLKPQNIPKLVELGSQDIAFTGYDWIVEEGAQVCELLDTGFDPVKVVAAMPAATDPCSLQGRRITVASEYENLTKSFLANRGLDFVFIRSFGATESFVPEDADMIVDNSSSGNTLKENGLSTYAEILSSSTRFVANRNALADAWKAQKISDVLLLLQSVLEARKRLLIEMNVPQDKLEAIMPALPSMKAPTVSKLYGDKQEGYAVKTAVLKDQVPALIPKLKALGATDILVYSLRQVTL